MSIDSQPTLFKLADWGQAIRECTPGRRELLCEAVRILTEKEYVRPEHRRELAEELEGWRYELLAQWKGDVAEDKRQLVDALDLAANDLVRGVPRPARRPRRALQNTEPIDGRLARAADCLDPLLPLDELTGTAARLSREHFGVPERGRRMLLYAPLYLSSHCTNHCVYCGFRGPLRIDRKHLSVDQAAGQADILRAWKIRHILLVAGDSPRLDTTDYFCEVTRRLTDRGICPAVEIAPQSTASYAQLSEAGIMGVTLYQETYNEELYTLYHPRGSKAQFDWRLEGLERAAEAGIGRLGLGVLLGLADPREDLSAMIRHADYLESRFPEHTLAFSLPRIHEAPQDFHAPFEIDDETFVRLYCTLRIAFPRAELVLSTRESAALRSRLAKICITQMSAASSTVPGGYNGDPSSVDGQQFPVSDNRSVEQVATWLRREGFDIAWRP